MFTFFKDLWQFFFTEDVPDKIKQIDEVILVDLAGALQQTFRFIWQRKKL